MIGGLVIALLLWWGGDDLDPRVARHANCVATLRLGLGQMCPALGQSKEMLHSDRTGDDHAREDPGPHPEP